jgi:GNAT superfamily N-acetyltransferase
MQSAVKQIICREVTIKKSARTLQVESMFDVPPEPISRVEFQLDFELPNVWNVGLIVGPSGAGKTTVAKELFGDRLITEYTWPTDKSILDAFPAKMSIDDITGLLSSVGFGSPPNWLRPYEVLSNGEKFRATVARAIAQESGIIAIDEFTSVIDRTVAEIASHTIQKAIRSSSRQFIAISCHYDVIDWLQPDWIYQPHGNQFQRRSLRPRPTFDLEIYPVNKSAWGLFKQYHYMSGSLHAAAKCFGGFIQGECVAFTSYRPFPHPTAKNIMMGHRLVVHPDYQGLGIGGRLDDWLGQYLYDLGYRYHNVVAHPAMIAYYSRSLRWKHERTGVLSTGSKKPTSRSAAALRQHQKRLSCQRSSSTFVYVPPAHNS